MDAVVDSLIGHANSLAEAAVSTSPEHADLASRVAGVSDRHRLLEALQASKLSSDTLLSMLVRQALISKSLSNRVAEIPDDGGSSAVSNGRDSPENPSSSRSVMIEFVGKLVSAGLTSRAVFNISNADIRAIVELISKRERGVSLPNLASLPLDVAASQRDDKLASTVLPFGNSTAMKGKPATTGTKPAKPPVVRTLDDWFELPDNPELGIAWEIDHWQPRFISGVTMDPENLPVPQYDTVEAMNLYEAGFASLSIDWSDAASIEAGLQLYIRTLVSPPNGKYPQNWTRLWVYILFARHDPKAFIRVFGDRAAAYFVGLMLARPHLGRVPGNPEFPQYEVRFSQVD